MRHRLRLGYYRSRAKGSGAGAIKIAMFDEVNEATSMFKVVSKRSQAPTQGYWLALDGDGLDLPSDWYLRVASEITQVSHGGKPVANLIPIKLTDPFIVSNSKNRNEKIGISLRWSRTPEGIIFQCKEYGGEILIPNLQGALIRTLGMRHGKVQWDYGDATQTKVSAGRYIAKQKDGVRPFGLGYLQFAHHRYRAYRSMARPK